MSTKSLRAGAARIDITPPLGGSLVGYMNDRRSTYIHDPLHARCLVLDNGKDKIAFVVCDLIAISKAQVDTARHQIHGHTGIPLHNVLICGTHTHSGATPAVLFQSDPDPRYLDWVVTRIVDGVRCAHGNLRPARIGWTIAKEPSLVFNRRYFMKPGTVPPNPFGGTDQVYMNPGILNPNVIKPAGPTDPDLALLALQSDAGEPLALLGSYALHYVGNIPATHVSADYFAMWSQEVARSLDQCCPADDRRPAFVAMLANACSGNINGIDVFHKFEQPYDYHEMRRVARALADTAVKAWRQISFHDQVPLAVRETTLELGVRKPTPPELERARGILAKAGPELHSQPEIYARETVLIAEWPDTRIVPIQAMRIGEFAIVTFPGEAFVELGLEVKQKSPFPQTMCIELANEYAGYIPPAAAFELGGYETWRARSSFLEKDAASKMVAAALRLLDEIKSAN